MCKVGLGFYGSKAREDVFNFIVKISPFAGTSSLVILSL